MAYYRGVVSGNHKEATRLGSRGSVLVTEAQSWQGKVVTTLRTQDNGIVISTVELMPHAGPSGPAHGVFKTLYEGPVGEFMPFAGCACE